MGSDVSLLVVDRSTGAVVCERWLGGRSTLEEAVTTLSRPPRTPQIGLECWTAVTEDEARRIAGASYGGGGTPEEMAVFSRRFPGPRYTWLIVRDF